MEMEWAAGLVKEFGLTGGLFAAFFIAAHAYAYGIVRMWIADLRRENRRLAEENREHRARFERMFGRIERGKQ